MKHVVMLSKQIRLVIEAETDADAVRKALQQDDDMRHVVQWVDCPAMAEVLGQELRKTDDEEDE